MHQLLVFQPQLRVDLGRRLLQFIKFRLLLGRKDELLLPLVFLLLQLAEFFLRLALLVLESLDFALLRLHRLCFHLMNARQRTALNRATADADEVVVARHLLDDILRQAQVPVHRSHQ